MAFINKTEKSNTILTTTIKNGNKLQMEKDVKVEITSYIEERKWIIKRNFIINK